MLFGKKEPERVSLADMPQLLDSLFERKIGNFGESAERIAKLAGRYKEEFESACGKLEGLDAAPYTEGLWMPNINSIKTNKVAYAKALKLTISGMTLDKGDSSTSYYRYKSVLSNIDEITTEILKINGTFKATMYSYSNYLGEFKRSFSMIERQRDELRRLVDSRSREAAEYSTLKNDISKMAFETEELGTLNDSIIALSASAGTGNVAEEDHEAGLSKELSARRSELASLDDKASSLSRRASSLTMPLDRLAKKFDHTFPRKRPLSPMIEDPINRITTDEAYSEFKSGLSELREAVGGGKIEAKNAEESIEMVSTLLSADILSMVVSINSLKENRSNLEEQIRVIERSMNEISRKRTDSQRVLHDIATMKEKTKEVERSRAATKTRCEALFSSYYKKAVSIAL